MLISSGKVFIDEKGKEFIKKIDKEGKEVIYYPPTEEEFFTKEEFNEIDNIRKME